MVQCCKYEDYFPCHSLHHEDKLAESLVILITLFQLQGHRVSNELWKMIMNGQWVSKDLEGGSIDLFQCLLLFQSLYLQITKLNYVKIDYKYVHYMRYEVFTAMKMLMLIICCMSQLSFHVEGTSNFFLNIIASSSVSSSSSSSSCHSTLVGQVLCRVSNYLCLPILAFYLPFSILVFSYLQLLSLRLSIIGFVVCPVSSSTHLNFQ